MISGRGSWIDSRFFWFSLFWLSVAATTAAPATAVLVTAVPATAVLVTAVPATAVPATAAPATAAGRTRDPLSAEASLEPPADQPSTATFLPTIAAATTVKGCAALGPRVAPMSVNRSAPAMVRCTTTNARRGPRAWRSTSLADARRRREGFHAATACAKRALIVVSPQPTFQVLRMATRVGVRRPVVRRLVPTAPASPKNPAVTNAWRTQDT